MEEDEDPWGDEPEWAHTDDNWDIESDSQRNTNKNSHDIGPAFGAQHILVLIDCAPSMFVPCVRLDNDQDEELLMETTSRRSCGESNSINDKNKSDLSTPFDIALIASERLLLQRVHYMSTTRTGKRDGVGVILYGMPLMELKKNQRDDNKSVKIKHEDSGGYDSDETDDREEVQMVSSTSLVDIAPPGIEQIQTLRSCLLPKHYGQPTGGARKRDLREEMYPKSSPGQTTTDNTCKESDSVAEDLQGCELRVALHEARKAFGNASCVKKTAVKPQDIKTIWIFTNQDDPTKGNDQEKNQIITAAKDVVDNGCEIRVWPLGNVSPFDRSLLFNHITTIQDGDSPEMIQQADNDENGSTLDIESLLDQIQSQSKRIRRLQTLPFLLPDWNLVGDGEDNSGSSYPGIMLDLFQPIIVKRKPIPVVMARESNKRTIRKTEIISKDTGEIVDKKDIRYYKEFCGERVPISREEVGNIRRLSNANPDRASLILLGFKPMPSNISAYSLVDKSIFAYPNDDKVKGSRRAFTALYASMIRKGVIGIGELLLRVTASSRLVAIYPQQEECLEEENNQGVPINTQVIPPGFNLIPLAFKDDMRSIPNNDDNHTASKEAVIAAMNLIKNQNIDGFELGDSFENPSLKAFWNYIESVSLGTPLLNNKKNYECTEMNAEAILQSAGEQIKALKLALPEDEIVVKQRKRKLKEEEVPDEMGVDLLNA